MAVKLRLTRMGRKKAPTYRIIAIDSRSRRDGKYLDMIGFYNPVDRPATLNIDHRKAVEWLKDGATPSDTVKSLFRRDGVMLRFDMTRRGYEAEKIETAVAELKNRHNGVFSKEALKKAEKPVFEKTIEKTEEAPRPKKAKAEKVEVAVETKSEEKAEAKESGTAEAVADSGEEHKSETASE